MGDRSEEQPVAGRKPDEEDSGVPDPRDRPVRWYLNSEHWLVVASRDILTAFAIVGIIGLLIVGVSGVWPPLVAVESGSMEPNINEGDLVFVVDTDRFTHDAATEDGIVTRATGIDVGHEQFDQPGSVIIFQPEDETATPIIHRVEYQVSEGDEWVETADENYLGGKSCADLDDVCPAPTDGYITRGDNNPEYDQVYGGDQAEIGIVESDQIEGKAAIRVPYLGNLRLALGG